MISKVTKGKKYYIVIPGNITSRMEQELWLEDMTKAMGIECVGWYYSKYINQLQLIEIEE